MAPVNKKMKSFEHKITFKLNSQKASKLLLNVPENKTGLRQQQQRDRNSIKYFLLSCSGHSLIEELNSLKLCNYTLWMRKKIINIYWKGCLHFSDLFRRSFVSLSTDNLPNILHRVSVSILMQFLFYWKFLSCNYLNFKMWQMNILTKFVQSFFCQACQELLCVPKCLAL